MELARKRRQKAAKDKADKLAPMVIEPTLSKLRTGKSQARGKGGSALMALSRLPRRAARSVAAAKAKKPRVSAQVKRNVEAGPKPRGRRTAAQRTADKKRLQNQMSETRSLGKLSSGMTKDLSKAQRATWEAIIGLATGGIGKGIQLGKGVHTAYKAKKAADVARAAAKAKRAAAAAKKAAEAKKGVSGIGQTRAASARARTSGLGKAKPKPKPKAKKKKSAAQTKRESMRGASAWR